MRTGGRGVATAVCDGGGVRRGETVLADVDGDRGSNRVRFEPRSDRESGRRQKLPKRRQSLGDDPVPDPFPVLLAVDEPCFVQDLEVMAYGGL